MRRVQTVSLVLAVAAAAALIGRWTSGASASVAASRVVDRTLLCRTGYSGGTRLVLLTARSAARSGDTLSWLANATVTTPGNPLSKQNSQPTLAGVTAGWPPPPSLTGGLGYENARCGPARTRVPLSAQGLSGGVASAFGEDRRCYAAKTLLIRVRATFTAPVAEEPSKAGNFISALGRIVTGQIAVRTLTGKPVAYADVADGGRARLFTRNGCL